MLFNILKIISICGTGDKEGDYEYKCAIFLDSRDLLYYSENRLACQHNTAFHMECIQRWLLTLNRQTCPICRERGKYMLRK